MPPKKEHICTQGDRITKIETVLDLTNKMAMEKFDNMEKKIDNNHTEIKEILKSWEDKFVLRSEFKVAVGVVSFLAVVVGFVSYFINK